ncbi:hypothetical protein Pmar_PMAR014290, partial [Perkinsus marinus ATCC 50983]
MNAIYKLRTVAKKKRGEAILGTGSTVASIRAFCEANNKVPDDENQPYCLAFDIKIGSSFYFVFSCTRLLREGTKHQTLTCDYTSAPSWLGMPLLVMGSLDWRGHFRPIAFALTSHQTQDDVASVFCCVARSAEKIHGPFVPSVLVADAAECFTNAYKQ